MENIVRPTFDQTVSVLVKAYLNNTLVPGWPCGCAVGNIIADKFGYKIELFDSEGVTAARWKDILDEGYHWFYTVRPQENDFVIFQFNKEYGVKQIESTGYTISEIERIEHAFESAHWTADTDARMFKGFMRVIDTLAEIHCIDLTTKDQAKQLFTKSI